ncbi:MAG: hypothetical protein ACPG7F_20935, partial [Aggregatilineales bacterium]
SLLPIFAQAPDIITCNDPRIYNLLEDINRYRVLEENLVPLALNINLCNVAYEHVLSLSTLPEDNIAYVDLQHRPDDSGLINWLQAINFDAYLNENADAVYAADIRVFFTRRYDDTAIIDYLLENEEPYYGRFFADERYREIGLASLYSPTIDAYFYTFIEAARPNVLPVLAVERETPYRIVDSLNNPEVTLVMHNENFAPNGHSLQIGQINRIRVNSTMDTVDGAGQGLCNIADDEGQPYSLYVIEKLEKTSGVHNISIDMCDTVSGRMISMPVQVTLNTVNPAPSARLCDNTLDDRLCSAMSGLERGIIENLLLVFAPHHGYESFTRCWTNNDMTERFNTPAVQMVGVRMDGSIIVQANITDNHFCNTRTMTDAFVGAEGVWLLPVNDLTLADAGLPDAPSDATHAGLVRDSAGLLRYVFIIPE